MHSLKKILTGVILLLLLHLNNIKISIRKIQLNIKINLLYYLYNNLKIDGKFMIIGSSQNNTKKLHYLYNLDEPHISTLECNELFYIIMDNNIYKCKRNQDSNVLNINSIGTTNSNSVDFNNSTQDVSFIKEGGLKQIKCCLGNIWPDYIIDTYNNN